MPRDNYVKVKKLDVFSVARMAAIFGVAVGVIALILSVAIAAIGGSIGVAVGIGIGIAILVVSIVGLFVGGAIEAFLYNVIARAVGPLRIVLQKDVVRKIDPLSYAKISFVFSLIVFGILAIFVSSVLLAAIGISSTAVSLPVTLIALAFVFALIVYGFVVPYVWALVYNWLADRIGGVGIVIRKGALERIDIWSYVKIVMVLSIIVFIIERIIGSVAGFALGMPQASPVLVLVVGFVAVVASSLVMNAIVAWYYNVAARRFGGCKISIGK